VEDGVFAWDTPVREVIEASPRDDKHIFIVENYPRKIDRLPSEMMEVVVDECLGSSSSHLKLGNSAKLLRLLE
jgi:hypothetical protein